MAHTLGRNLHLCFKRPLPPPTPDDHSRPSSSILVKNFNSLYNHSTTTTTFDSTSKSHTHSSDLSSSGSDTEETATTPDFATIYASQRFFFSSPGPSNSIVDSSSSECNRPESDTLVGGSVAIRTYSPDPYVDFRRSMQEMVEARDLADVRANWDYLHELLLCYLALNPKSTHKFIVGAFSDLLVSLMSKAAEESGDRQKNNISAGSCAVKRQVM